MDDSLLNRLLTPGSSLQETLPVVALFFVVWFMVFAALYETSVLPKRAAAILSVCVTLLALFGMREEQLELICQHYALMAIAMLVTLAAAIRVLWKKALTKTN